MTKATTEGRRLMLAIEGIDDIIAVDPLTAKRGRVLTERFLAIALGQTPHAPEAIFAEALGAENYARISGDNVRTFDAEGRYALTATPAGWISEEDVEPVEVGVRCVIVPTEEDGLPIRQEEAEALCLVAFYWQTVVGMEAVQAFLDAGEGTEASLKALRLLLTRTTLSTQLGSSPRGMGSSMQEASSTGTTATAISSSGAQPNAGAAVHLPPTKRGHLPKRGSAFRR